MKKPILPLIILCIVALPFIGTAQTMYSPVEPNAKLKKGDWFNIEFANRLEDYSTPVDSVNYCDPENLLQLVLHCEVTDVSKKKLNLKITLERLFHITDSGEYYDSYFDIIGDYDRSVLGGIDYVEEQYFEINTKINFKSNDIEQDHMRLGQYNGIPYYYYKVLRKDIQTDHDYVTPFGLSKSTHLTGAITQNSRLILIQISEIKELVSAYLKDWSANEYKLPLPPFGNIQVADFCKYRIIDSNIPVQKNTVLVIEGELTTNDLVEVLIKDEFDYLTSPKIKYKLNGYLKDGRIVFEYYLDKQREMTLRYRGKEMKFISTPGKELNLKLHLNNDVLAADFTGDNVGDNSCEKELASSCFILPKSFDWDYFKDSYEAFHDTLEKKTLNLIKKLDQHKNQMTVNRYKKKLKMIYYWAATQSAEWHPYHMKAANYVEFNDKFDYTKLNEMSYYKNIDPLYDYYMEPDFYKEYLEVYAKISINQDYMRNWLTSEIQGFQRERFAPGYFLLNILFIGYPKYYYLANEMITPNGRLSRVKPGNVTVKEYNHFMTACDYPPFLDQVQKAYEMAIETDIQKSILDLDLNIVKDKNYQKNSGNYKLIGFINDRIDQQKISEIRDSIVNIENRFDLKKNIETYLIYTDDNMISDVAEILPTYKDLSMKLVKLTRDEFYSDMEKLALLRYGDFPMGETVSVALLTGKNEIIALGLGIRLLDFSFKQYESHLEYIKSQKKDNSQIIIIILSSLLFFWFLSWFVIRVRTVQIQKRETARRKVSELELTAIRSQMNPHFIFNAMGSIQNLINQNKVKNANLYLASFARLMRMVLANSNKKLVSMSHELELIETYLKLEQLRVDFTFTISVAENIDPEVEELPGMLIQPFVENAVIHGITPKGTGNIEVSFSKKENTLICEITDDGVGIDVNKAENGNGLAMKLSEKRLDLLNSQLQDKLKLVVENRMETEQTSGTKITLYIPVG